MAPQQRHQEHSSSTAIESTMAAAAMQDVDVTPSCRNPMATPHRSEAEYLDDLKALSPSIVQNYLSSRGWQLTHDLRGLQPPIQLAEYRLNDEVVYVPLEQRMVDYSRRMHDALADVAQLEGRADRELAYSLLRNDGDHVEGRVRFTLEGEAVNRAIEAHKAGQRIDVVGTLRKVGRTWQLDQAEIVAVVTLDEDS